MSNPTPEGPARVERDPGDREPADRGPADGGGTSWGEAVELTPALARAGLLAGHRLVDWTTSSAISVSRTVLVSVSDVAGGRQSPLRLVTGVTDEVLETARRLLGITALEAEVRRLTGERRPAAAADRAQPAPPVSTPAPPPPASPVATAPPPPSAPVDTSPSSPADASSPTSDPARPDLRERARGLLARSSRLEDDDEHPAFGIVLEQLAPDEMRILTVLAHGGDQAAMDVESRGPFGGQGRVVARRLTLLAQVAGCKHPERLPVHLENLERLGLTYLDDDPLDDSDYEVIEAQAETEDARRQASHGATSARLVRRRVGLSDFGRSFCEVCLPDRREAPAVAAALSPAPGDGDVAGPAAGA